MDQGTRKLMTMHKALHLTDNVDRLYVTRKEGGRGLTSIQDRVDALIQRLEDYIKSAKENWLQPPYWRNLTQVDLDIAEKERA